jgi:UDP-2,3-diacylglucosamine pyrophosphatase LpxH
MKRKLEIAVISDVHLGTYGCHARELLNYLKSIKPDILILNGDFVDMWEFRKSYFPKEHMKVLNRVMKMSLSGTKVYYITGNHDDVLRRFSDFSIGDFHLRDSLTLLLNGKKCWFFHGDVFDASMQLRGLAKLGGYSYNLLIRMNKSVNFLMKMMGKERVAFSKIVKMKVKEAVKFIGDFEQKAIDMGQRQGFDTVICGHVHTPQMRQEGAVLYLNSGDWVENLSALEYAHNSWSIYQYDELDYNLISPRLQISPSDIEIDEDEIRIGEPQTVLVAQFFDNMNGNKLRK